MGGVMRGPRRAPRRRLRACGRRSPRRGRGRRTRPRTATAAGRRRDRAARGRRRRGRRCRRRVAPAKSATGSGLKKRVTRPGAEATCSGRSAASRREAAGEPVGQLAEPLVGGGVERVERRQPGGDRERVARERPRLVDVAGRGDPFHRLARAAERRRRQAAADDLAHHGQVGFDPVELLGAAAGDAEAGDHLVEDQQRPGLAGRLAEELEEALGRRDDAHVGRDRLGQERRDLVLGERPRRPPRGRSTARRRCPPPAPRSPRGCRARPASPGPSRRRRAGRRSGRGRRRRT